VNRPGGIFHKNGLQQAGISKFTRFYLNAISPWAIFLIAMLLENISQCLSRAFWKRKLIMSCFSC
jgi:hypothetical protein